MDTAVGPGRLLPAFTLPILNRQGAISSWDYKQRRNLVLLFATPLRECSGLIERLSARYDAYRQLDCEILLITTDEEIAARAFRVPFPILHDETALVRRRMLGEDSAHDVKAVTALVADRWGEVYRRLEFHPGDPEKAERELISWVEFVDIQCNECFPSEWPPLN